MTKTFRLPNGVTCVCEQRPKSGKVNMMIGIKAGSMHEGMDEAGLTHLMQESTWGGTTSRSTEQIFEDIESRGGSFGSDTGRQSTMFTATALSRDAKHIFAILADVVRNPVFDAEEIRKTKERIGMMIDGENQSAAGRAQQEFVKKAFENQPIATSPAGTKDMIASYTQQQIHDKHAELLEYPENIVISFVGDIAPRSAEKLAKDFFGDLKPSATPRPPVTVDFKGGDFREANNNNQLNLVFGFEAPSINDPKKYHVMMLKELISGGMSSPLFKEIREKRGLVYGVNAGYSPFESAGLFSITAGTGKGNAGELITVAMDLLGDVIKNGFSDDDMKIARERIIRSSQGAQESAKSVCIGNASNIMNYGRIVPMAEFEANLAKVTSDDIRATMAQMLSSGKHALAGIGPQDSMPSSADIKNMMQAQLQNVQIPQVAAPVLSVLTPAFNAASKRKNILKADPQVSMLSNGMIVVTAERPGTLSCGAWVGAGSDHETPELNGATHMNEHMMFKGTPSYGPGTIDKIVESQLGADLNAYTSKDKTAYYFYNLLAKDIEKVVDICGEMVFKANLDHEEFDGKTTINPDGSTTKAKGERDVVIEEIKRANDKIGDRLWYLSAELAHPNQPHGRRVLGTEATLRAMTVQMLAAYRDEYYVPNNVVFSAAGPVKHKDFVALIERKFGSMPSHNIPALPVPTHHEGTAYLEMESAELCEMVLGFEGVSDTHPDVYAYEALGVILGGSASSRLYKALVNTALTSSAGAGMQDFRNCGQFLAMVSIDPPRAKLATQIIFDEMRKLTHNVEQKELDAAKAKLEMACLSRIETNRSACDTYGNQTLSAGKPMTAAELSAHINSVTLADIKRVSHKVLTSKPTLAMVVPQGIDPNLLPAHQDVLSYQQGQAQTPAPQAGQKPQP